MMDAMEWLPQTKACFGCGHGNPAGVALRMKTDGKAIHAQLVPEVRHAGFSHAIHGGVITTVLDEMMAWACGILGGTFAYSVDMNIRFHRLLSPGQTVHCLGRLDENRRGKLFLASAELSVEDTCIASGSAKFFPIKEDALSMLQSEFGDQWEAIQQAMHHHGHGR